MSGGANVGSRSPGYTVLVINRMQLIVLKSTPEVSKTSTRSLEPVGTRVSLAA